MEAKSKKKIDKHKILKAVKSDFKNADTLRKDIDVNIRARRRTYNGEAYGNEEKGKSRIVPKVAKRQQAWAHPSLKEPFVSTPNLVRFSPVTADDVEAARQNELLLNTQFCRQFDRYNFMTKTLKVLEVDATVFVQTGWEYEEEEVEQEVEVVVVDEYGQQRVMTEVQKVTVPVVNKPTARVCRSEDIFPDPTCEDDLSKAQFVVYRYETDLSTLRKDGRYKNLDNVMQNMMSAEELDPDYINPDNTWFKFEDAPRKKLLVHEYWGNYDINDDGIAEPIVCVWVDSTIIRLEDNPYPDKKIPFLSCAADSVPFKLYGENDIDNIEDQQKVITAITRGIINNMAASNNGQVGIRKGALDPVQKKRMLDGKNFEFNGNPSDIWQGSYNQIPASAFNMLQMMNGEVDSLTGTKGFSGGISGGSLGSSATAARGVLDATAVRRLDKVRNIAENLIKPLIRKWMDYNSEFLSDEEIIRTTENEHVAIRKSDLQGRLDVDIEISTPEDDTAKRNELGFLLQTMGPNLPFEMTQMILSEIARLNRMPKLEKSIKGYKPQPNPQEEELKKLQAQKLQMDIAKTKAEIQKIFTESIENKEGDLAKKQAQAELLRAQAELLGSKKDTEDLNFVKTDNQENEQFQLEKLKLEQQHKAEMEALKAKMNLIQMQYQRDAGDKQLGVMQ